MAIPFCAGLARSSRCAKAGVLITPFPAVTPSCGEATDLLSVEDKLAPEGPNKKLQALRLSTFTQHKSNEMAKSRSLILRNMTSIIHFLAED
ncbi:hypothetical protein [Aeromonas veronii]|uniref:hypothetical protein n=1 Tax=Aeromonas veronii TaxID=654 RepID=UPI00300436B8